MHVGTSLLGFSLLVMACTDLTTAGTAPPDGAVEKPCGYIDRDGDGFGGRMASDAECVGDAVVRLDGDCDDLDSERSPGDAESCSKTQDDCSVGEGCRDGGEADSAVPIDGGRTPTAAGMDGGEPSPGLKDGSTQQDPCATATCGPGTCQATASGDHSCECPKGFDGTGTKRCVCPFSAVLEPSGLTCRTPGWSETAKLVTSAVGTGRLSFDLARDGSGLLTALELANSEPRLHVRVFDPAVGWLAGSQPTPIPGIRSDALSIAALSKGRGIALYLEAGSNSQELRSATISGAGLANIKFHDQAVWGDGSYAPRLSGNGADHVVASWYTFDPTVRAYAFLDSYADGTGWRGLERQLESTSAPTTAVDLAGNELILHENRYAVRKAATDVLGPFQTDGAMCEPIRMNAHGTAVGGRAPECMFALASGWQPLPPSAADPTTAVSDIDDGGNILTVWSDDSAVRYRVFNGAAWSDPGVIQTTSDVEHLQLDVAPNGEAVVAWSRVNYGTVEAARFDPRFQAWTVPKMIGPASGTIVQLQVGMSGPSLAVAVWSNSRTVGGESVMDIVTSVLR